MPSLLAPHYFLWSNIVSNTGIENQDLQGHLVKKDLKVLVENQVCLSKRIN